MSLWFTAQCTPNLFETPVDCHYADLVCSPLSTPVLYHYRDRSSTSLVPRYLYIGHSGINALSIYTLDFTTGFLTPLSNVTTTGNTTESIVINDAGTVLYAGVGVGTQIERYSIDTATGLLTFQQQIAATSSPNSLLLSPDGNFLYVLTPAVVDVFTVAGDGTLTNASLSTGITPGTTGAALAMTPDGQYLYSSNSGSGDVTRFTRNTSTGALTNNGVVGVGASPAGTTMNADGTNLYVANSGGGSVSAFTINADGSLTTIATPASTPGLNPRWFIPHPTLSRAYSVNSGSDDLGVWTASTGSISNSGSVINTDTFPSHALFDPTTTYFYVTNQTSQTVVSYSVDAATGDLTQIDSDTTLTSAPRIMAIAAYRE